MLNNHYCWSEHAASHGLKCRHKYLRQLSYIPSFPQAHCCRSVPEATILQPSAQILAVITSYPLSKHPKESPCEYFDRGRRRLLELGLVSVVITECLHEIEDGLLGGTGNASGVEDGLVVTGGVPRRSNAEETWLRVRQAALLFAHTG